MKPLKSWCSAVGFEVSRKHIATLLLQVFLACSACGDRDAKKADLGGRENEFQKKRVCAEFGRQRLALDSRKEEEGVTPAVSAEWCYSTMLNTCIYSATVNVWFAPKDPNSLEQLGLSLQSTVDLLTNRTLISANRTKSTPAKLVEYEKKKKKLFSKCL